MTDAARASLADAVRTSDLVSEGSGLALCSGGADSTGLLAGLVDVAGAERVVALHVNYGLRPDSGSDEAACARSCRELGVELVVERAALPGRGNLQAHAREARYEAAERLRRRRGLDWIATGHTRTDLAETVIYRLAASPGRRALLGLRARRGRLVRPLLGVTREQLRAWVSAAGLPFRDDPTNAGPAFARNRIRNEVLPVLAELAPAAEATIAGTQAELLEEAETLDRLAADALAAAGADYSGALYADALAALDPAVGRLALRALAERAAGHPVALGRERAAAIRRLAGSPEGGTIELGAGVEARVEQGKVSFAAGIAPEPADTVLSVPGSCRFGDWEIRAELGGRAVPGAARLDPARLERQLGVRAWRSGDRMRPLGLGGSKSLQDIFGDRKVPRSLRGTVPVVTSGDRIAWVAGIAVSGEFAADAGGGEATVLCVASRRPPDP